VICILISGIISIQLAKAKKVGIYVLALIGGMLFGLILANALLISSKFLFRATMFLSLFVWFYTAYKYEGFILKMGSSFVGSFLFVQGICLFYHIFFI
jgi:hypothetical protein